MTGDLRPRRIAWAAELTALTLSVAANVAATIDGGVIGIVAGAATPLLLVLAVYLWRAFPGAVGWQRRLATVAMACVLGPVAVASYVHIADVVYESGAFARWLSWVIPLSVDGLAVRASLALWSPVRPVVREETLTEISEEHSISVAVESEETYVYKFMSLGELAYVGTTGVLRGRIREHARKQPWWREIDAVTVTAYPRRIQALAVEAYVIEHEKPKYNMQSGSLRDAATDATDTWGPGYGRVSDYEASDLLYQPPVVVPTDDASDGSDDALVPDDPTSESVDADVIMILPPTKTEADRVNELLDADPTMSLRAIAERVGCSKHRAGQYKKLWMGDAS